MGPEQPLPSAANYSVFEMARLFNGINYSGNRQGLVAATDMLKSQHEKVMPPIKGLHEIVAKKDPLIEQTWQTAMTATDAEDYETALSATNHLYAYGDIDYKDSLGGGEPFNLSLIAHRALVEKIRGKFSSSDRFLRISGRSLLMESELLRLQGKYPRELELLRGLIHMVALNGTLGEGAKQKFDPGSIIHLDKLD